MHHYRRSKWNWSGNRQAGLHEDGYVVLFCDVDRANGERLAADLSLDNQAVYFVPCDIKSDADVSRMTQVAAGLGIQLYAVINNAGIFPRREFLGNLFAGVE